MTIFGWIIISFLSLIMIAFGVRFVRDLLWNQKLGYFQKTKSISLSKVPRIYWLKRSYGFVLTSLLLVTMIFSGIFAPFKMMGDRVLQHAIPVESRSTLENLIVSSTAFTFSSFFDESFNNTDLAPKSALEERSQDNDVQRDYIGTNVQVEGVDEADIIKTDGNTIYYATRYHNRIRVLDVNDDATVSPLADIDLGVMYTEALYLTTTQLIVIGYIYHTLPFTYEDGIQIMPWGYTSYTGAVYIYNRETLEIEYKLETDSNFYQHRRIDDALYLVSSKSFLTDELRPMYQQTVQGESSTSYLGYDNMFYFDDVPVYSMTVITGIKLDTYDLSSQAFLGDVSLIYASESAIYTVNNHYKTTTWNKAQQYAQIIKYNLNHEDATVTYAGQKSLTGYVGDPYWMDEYDGYLRVVTSSWEPIVNQLFILEEDENTDDMNIVGSITQGLGKINETVKSVRFNETLAYVVTFEQTDPLYTIDLEDPTDPNILSAIEEPGYSTYLHVWGQDNRLIGFGVSADLNGRVTGLKISAYDTDETNPIDTYQLNEQDGLGNFWAYSEALHNPKAMMISPDKGIIAFPVMSYRYALGPDETYQYSYQAQYLIFFIDFDAEDPDDIISDPIVIVHDSTEDYNYIDRGLYINHVIYTLSYAQLVSYDLTSNTIIETIIFDTYFEENTDKIYID